MKRRLGIRLLIMPLSCGLLSACAGQTFSSAANTGSLSQASLTGATPQLLNADFGPPSLQRTDGQAQVWLYQTPHCNLNVFLYPDSQGVPRVTSMLPDNGVTLRSCLLGLGRATATAALEHAAAS